MSTKYVAVPADLLARIRRETEMALNGHADDLAHATGGTACEAETIEEASQQLEASLQTYRAFRPTLDAYPAHVVAEAATICISFDASRIADDRLTLDEAAEVLARVDRLRGLVAEATAA